LVTRYDRRTQKVQTLGTPPEPFNVVADANNAWVSSLKTSRIITRLAKFGTGPSAGWGTLDPASTPKIRLPKPGATGLARGSGYLWAIAGPKTSFGIDDRVWLIEPATNEIVQTLHLGRQTTSIDFGDGAAWIGAFASERKEKLYTSGVAGASWLFSVRTGAAGLRTRRYRLEKGDTAGPLAVSAGLAKVWVPTCGYCNRGFDNQKLLEFDPAKWKVVHEIPLGHRNPNALAVGGGFVWVASQVDASVLRIDPKTWQIRTVPVGSPNAAICGIAGAHDGLWVAVGNRQCESTGG
jgi:hypothetical protein